MIPRRSLAAGALFAGLFVAAGSIELPGLAYAHDLTGGGATATCVDGHVQVRWTFTTLNAGDHLIESVSFDRPVTSQSVSGTTVTATTNDKPGAPELTTTAIYEDGWQSTSAVSTVVPDDVCPVVTTTTTTVEPHFALPPIIAITDPTTTIIPTVDATVPNSPTSSVAPPATSQPSAPAPTGPATTAARVPTQLPVTGGGQDALVFGLAVAGLGTFLIVATRRRAAK